jgi:hypothetical protein
VLLLLLLCVQARWKEKVVAALSSVSKEEEANGEVAEVVRAVEALTNVEVHGATSGRSEHGWSRVGRRQGC